MDIISHGLWGGLACGRKSKKEYAWAFFFGITPDLFSFGIYTALRVLGLEPSVGYMDASLIPQYVHVLYSITHSLFVFALVCGILWIILKHPFVPVFAWLFHILLDIPTHSIEFFPTPFLWPLSNIRVDGISWGTPIVFYTNVSLLVCTYLLYGIVRHFRKKKACLS